MQTISGLQTYLNARLGTVGLAVMVVLAVAITVAVGLAFLVLGELFAAGSDPLQMAPVRWISRRG